MTPKCENCKFAGHNRNKKGSVNACCYFPMYDKNDKYIQRLLKYTTNSRNFTHCDKHEYLIKS